MGIARHLRDDVSTVDQPHPNAALGTEPIRTISRDELKEMLDRGDDLKLIMALNRWAFDAKHIPGSIHFDTPDELYAAVGPDDEIVVYCSHFDCLSSVALYRDLVRRGYRHVRRYGGGLLDWEDADSRSRASSGPDDRPVGRPSRWRGQPPLR